jgi:hypothetical protein
MKTAKQHNAEQCGEYSFNPTESGRLQILEALFASLGAKFVTVKATKPKRKKGKKK